MAIDLFPLYHLTHIVAVFSLLIFPSTSRLHAKPAVHFPNPHHHGSSPSIAHYQLHPVIQCKITQCSLQSPGRRISSRVSLMTPAGHPGAQLDGGTQAGEKYIKKTSRYIECMIDCSHRLFISCIVFHFIFTSCCQNAALKAKKDEQGH